MATIHPVQIDDDRSQVRELFWEYLVWANERLNEEYGIDLEIQSMLEHHMSQLQMFFPPHGCLLLVTEGSALAGIGCLKRIRADIGEIKRMYIRPGFRGQGLGRALLDALLAEARGIGYQTVRLDSTRFMQAAHSLYRSAGFQEIEPYPESEIPAEFRQHWVFMEKPL
jgi:GNAT superfamily N-acetyltransferase